MSGIIANKMDLPSAKQNILGFVEDLNNQYQGMPFKLFHKRALVILLHRKGLLF